MSSEETAVEQRAFARLQRSLPALAAEYRSKFGNEISTDNAREVVSPEYAASKEGRTRWSAATQKPAGALADRLFDDALRNPDPAKPRVVVMTAGEPAWEKPPFSATTANSPMVSSFTTATSGARNRASGKSMRRGRPETWFA